MLNKTLYKVFLISIRIAPIIIAFIYVVNSVLSYIGIDLPILSYIVFSMFILFMYAVSFIFKFCSLHRMFIHYITLNTVVTAVDYNWGIPISDGTLFIFNIVVLLIFIITIIYLSSMNCISKLVVSQLKKIINNIESGSCELTEEEALNLLLVISNEPMSKEQACSYLNISRSKFDDYIRKGILPKGRKRRGFKELVWYKSELIIK